MSRQGRVSVVYPEDEGGECSVSLTMDNDAHTWVFTSEQAEHLAHLLTRGAQLARDVTPSELQAERKGRK